MRRKQLYAILLVGVLAAGNVPSSVLAAEGTVSEGLENETSVSAASDGADSGQQVSDIGKNDVTNLPAEPTPTPVQSTETEPTPTPAETVPTQAAGNTITETPSQQENDQTKNEQAVLSDQTSDSEENVDSSSDLQQEDTDTGIRIKAASENGEDVYYESLQEAIDSVPAATGAADEQTTVIEITKQLSLSATVNISGKKVCIRSAVNGLSIGRKNPDDTVLTGDMFSVSGENSELQFSAAEGCSLTINGNNGTDTACEGSVVRITEGGKFGLFSNVTLTGNNSTANGGAITNEGGNIVFGGGSITGNRGGKGAVYTNTDVLIQGTVSIKDNTAPNLYLDNAAIVVTGAMTDSAVSFTDSSAADQKAVIWAGRKEDNTPLTQEEFTDAVTQFTYESSDFTIEIAEDGSGAVLRKLTAATATPTPTVTVTPTSTPTPDDTDEPSTPVKDSFLTWQNTKGVEWYSRTSARIVLSTSEPCKWYYLNVDKSRIKTNADIDALYEPDRQNMAEATNTLWVDIKGISDDKYTIVYAKSIETGNWDWKCFNLSASTTRPKTESSAPTSRTPKSYSVTESIVTGLEESLKFFPEKFYEFSVTGAGQNDSGPYVTGDERWIPLYWSTSQNPTTDSQKQKTWRIGSVSGIRQAATYNMYIFFKKQAYNGSDWVDTDVVEYTVIQFRSAEISDEEWNAWLAAQNITPDPDGGYGDDGSIVDVVDPEGASYKDGASDTKSAVYTADPSPVGTMSALAALSLAAGGYILVRKRKKES